MASPEDRVTRLERDVDQLQRDAQEDRHRHQSDHGAHSHALSLIHADLTEFRGEMDGFRSETRERFDRVEATLAEVLRRLPEPGEQA